MSAATGHVAGMGSVASSPRDAISGLKANVMVCARVRPLFGCGAEGTSQCVITAADKKRIVLEDPRHRELPKEFPFDHVFDSSVTTSTIFKTHVARGIDAAVLSHVPCTVFAHGASGSGKTFTMQGIEGQPAEPVVSGNETGLIPMCVERIFKRVTSDMMVTMSVFEIYQEKVRDLLAQSTDQQHAGPGGGGRRGVGSGSQPALLDRDGGFRDLKMLEDSLGQVTIMGLVEREVTSSGELLQAYEGAISLRAVGSTAINQQSSRSHCTLQIQVQKRQRNAPAGAPVASSGRGRRSGLSFHEQKKVVPMGRIMLVDLAGLEDNRVTGNVGGALRESTAINTSHFALARMLWALKKNRNVPYRNSKLTRLFQNSMEPSIPLPAPPMVLMLVTVSPATKRFQATYNTFSAIQIDYKTISAEECEGIREEAVAAVARDREMIDVDDDDDVDAMSVTYEGSEDPNPSGFLSPHDSLLIDTRPPLPRDDRSMCPVVEEEESLKDVDIRDDYTDTDCVEPIRPSPKKRSRLEGNAAGRASMAQLVVNQDVTPKGRSRMPSGTVTRSMSQNAKGVVGAVGGGRSRSLNPAPTRRGAAARRLTGTRSVADIQADHAAAEMDTVVKKAVAGIVQSIRIKAIEMIEQELLPTVEAMAEAGIREALATGTSDGRRTRSSSLDIVVESPTSQRKD